MDRLVQLELAEEQAVFGINEESTHYSVVEDEAIGLSLEVSKVDLSLVEEHCLFSLLIATLPNKELYDPLYCEDGLVHTSDGEPIYVLRWRIN